MNSRLVALLLASIFILAPLSGCFGEEEVENVAASSVLQIDYLDPSDAIMRTGEWHDFTLDGEGYSLVSPSDILLFVDNTYVVTHQVDGGKLTVKGMILTTPFTDNVTLSLIHPDGSSEQIEVELTNGTPIVSGSEWFEKMDFITSVCSDSTECGGYINRWMGTPNPAFERAASFFQGHFEGLGYETHVLRVTDHQNPSEPESLNVIAWKRGIRDDCVQGMGAHMDIAPPGGPPGGGTYEGAYDNTAGTVSMMLFAKAMVDYNLNVTLS